MKHRAKLIAVFIGVALSARADIEPPRECSHLPKASSASPKMKSTAVLAVAKRAASNAKYELAEFEEPSICFNSAEKTWNVFFEDRPVKGLRALDKHFGVVVRDRDGRTTVMHGGG